MERAEPSFNMMRNLKTSILVLQIKGANKKQFFFGYATGISRKGLFIQTTMGLYLVTMLTEKQLDGEVELNREVGTQYSIRFAKQEYKPRI